MTLIWLTVLNLVDSLAQVALTGWALQWRIRFAGLPLKEWIPFALFSPVAIANSFGTILFTGRILHGGTKGMMPERTQHIWFGLILFWCVPQALWFLWRGLWMSLKADELARSRRLWRLCSDSENAARLQKAEETAAKYLRKERKPDAVGLG